MPRPTFGRRRDVLSRLSAVLLVSALGAVMARGSDFATSVIDYTPAPGQFVNNPDFNVASRALGPPVGGGTNAADNTKMVSLGGFGGSITLRFAEAVLDDPLNPWGLDAIVFGNSFFVSNNLNRRYAEAATIEISLDVNANGLADDPWYVIRGSSLPAIPDSVRQTQAWDNNASTPTPPTNLAWYPMAPAFPNWPVAYMTSAFRLPAAFEVVVLQNPNGLGATMEGHYGYADVSPTLKLGDTNADDVIDNPSIDPASFYTLPDNPFVVGVTPGSSGGDAFDIAWAIDPATGESAGLHGFDFIRITTAVNRVDVIFGETSTEIGGVADVRRHPSFYDVNQDGVVNAEDVYSFHRSPIDLTGEGAITSADTRAMSRAARADESGDVNTR